MTERSSAFDRSAHQPVPLWRDIRVLQVMAQIAFLIAVVIVSYILLNNLVTGLRQSNLAINFGVLTRTFGTQISEGQMDFRPGESSNWDALMAGLKNTLRVVIVGLAGATVLGVFVGIGRLSANFLFRAVWMCYFGVF